MNPNDILNPTVFYAGWELREPVTSATDFLVAVMAALSLWRLWKRQQGSQTVAQQLMRGYFVCLALGMGCAAILGHLVQAYVPWEAKAVGWIFSAVGIACFEASSLSQNRPHLSRLAQRLLNGWVLLHLGLFLLAMCLPAWRNFETVKLNSALGLMGTVLPLQAYRLWRSQAPASRWFVGAVLFGVFPALTFNLEISFSRWFNYHDISHVLMATYVYLVYQGAKRLPDASQAARPSPAARPLEMKTS